MAWAERPPEQQVGGYKDDTEKTRWALLPTVPLREAAETFTYGMRKYAIDERNASANNWLGGMPFSQVASAMMRHYTAWWEGEQNDQESGIHHLGHALACMMMLTEYDMKPELYGHLDDRPTPTNVKKFHKHLEKQVEPERVINGGSTYNSEVEFVPLPHILQRKPDVSHPNWPYQVTSADDSTELPPPTATPDYMPIF